MAAEFNYLTFTKTPTTTGIQTIAGGKAFTGKAAIIFSTRRTAIGLGDGIAQCYGLTDGTDQGCRTIALSDNVATGSHTSNQSERTDCLVFFAAKTTGASGTVEVQGEFAGFTADGGIEIDWTTNDGDATLFHLFVIGGDGVSCDYVPTKITVDNGDTLVKTTTVNPDCFIVLGGAVGEFGGSDYNLGTPWGSIHGFGFSNASTNVCGWTLAVTGTTSAYRGSHDDQCASVRAANVTGAADLCGIRITGKGAGTFTVTRVAGTTTHQPVQHILAIQGVQFRLGAFPTPAAPGAYTLPIDFVPDAVMLQTSGKASGLQTGLGLACGVWTPTADGGTWIGGEISSGTSILASEDYNDVTLRHRNAAATGSSSVADLEATVAATAGGAEVTFATVPATPATVLYIAMAPAPAPSSDLDGEPGELAVVTLVDRSDVERPYAEVDLNDEPGYYGGYKAPKLLQVHPIVRALSDHTGQMQHPTFGATLADNDRTLRALLEDATDRYLTNCPLIVRTVDDEVRRAEGLMHHEMVGTVSDWSPAEDLTFILQGSDALKRKLDRRATAPEFWVPLLTRTDFAQLPTELENTMAPLPYGRLTDAIEGVTPSADLYPRGNADPGWQHWGGVDQAGGGTLASGTYYAWVTAIRGGVESTVAAHIGVTLTGPTSVDIEFRSVVVPDLYRVYFSDGDDFNPFTTPSGGSFARYQDFHPSAVPEAGSKTFATVRSEMTTSAAGSDLVADYGPYIGGPDASNLQDYYDLNGEIPDNQYDLGRMIGHGDLANLMAGRRAVTITATTWGSDYVAIAGSGQAAGRGIVPTKYVGSETYAGVTRSAFLVCRGAIKNITSVHVGGAQVSSTGSSTELLVPFMGDYATVFGANYRDINSRRYTIVYATGTTAINAINGSKPITLNIEGFEDAGDTTGTLLKSPVRQRQHFERNFLFADDPADIGTVWLSVAPNLPGLAIPMQDDASYDQADTDLQARLAGGYETAGIIGWDGAVVSALDALALFHVNGDFDAGTNRLGQSYVSVEPVSAPAAAAVVKLTDVLHIVDRSFAARTDQFRNFWNIIPFAYAKDYTGTTDRGWYLRGESRDAASITNYAQERTSSELQFPFLRANTTQQADTTLDVILRKRARYRHPRRTVTLSAPYLASYQVELGTVLRLDHLEGIGADGWEGHDVRVVGITTDLQQWVRVFECYDLQPIYDGLDDAVEPTEEAEGIRDSTGLVELQENVRDAQVELAALQALVALIESTKITGPASATDNAIVRYDGITGKLAQDSTPKVADDGRITDLTNPTAAQDAATKAYVDTATLRGVTVRAATTANITIATALNNGDTLDGVTLATGDRVLVKNQTAQEENGVYEVGASPARVTGFDTFNEHPGALITVQEGTANADTIWLCEADNGGTLGTTAITFTEIGAGGGGGTPGGSDGQVQYNNAGAFGGIANGTTGQVLTADGSGAPSFQTLPAAGAAAIEPDALSGLQVWLDADQITGLVDTDPVATWADASGNSRDATQGTAANRPVYRTNIVNGKPVVRFDASNDGMTIPYTTSAPSTIMYVGNYNVANGLRRAVQGQVNNRLMGPYNGYWSVYTGSFLNLGRQLPRANFVVHGFSHEASTYGWWLYDSYGFPMGGLTYGFAIGTVTPLGALALGAAGSVAEPFGGDMAELVVYNRTLTDTEAKGLIQYFINKYAL
jgi:hypothetical protein